MSESTTTKRMGAIVIAGTKPLGSCTPDGTHMWATLDYFDGQWTFTKFNGWLIAGETRTTDKELVNIITDAYRAEC